MVKQTSDQISKIVIAALKQAQKLQIRRGLRSSSGAGSGEGLCQVIADCQSLKPGLGPLGRVRVNGMAGSLRPGEQDTQSMTKQSM